MRLTTTNQVTRIDMLLRVISSIDTELVAPRDSSRPPALVKRVADIKDAMRDDCVPLIVELCYGVIVSYSRAAADAWPGAALLVDAALNVLQCYVSWVDIELVIAPEVRVTRCALFCVIVHRRGAAVFVCLCMCSVWRY